MWFVLEPLIVKNDSYSFGFYKTLVERMKNHKDALDPDNEEILCVRKKIFLRIKYLFIRITINSKS